MVTSNTQSNEQVEHGSAASALGRRFVPLEHVQEALSISRSQAYALVRSGDLRAIRVGGRGQWRVELAELEAYIQRAYEATAAEIATEQAVD